MVKENCDGHPVCGYLPIDEAHQAREINVE